MTDLDYFFDPKSVAIIGASENIGFGYATTKYLLSSKFKTFPVSVTKEEIFGHKAYKNIKDISEYIDLAIIMIKNEFVLQAVKDCVEKGVKGIIIESAGFAETGIEKYIKMQEEIIKIAKASKIRIIGPNCIGVNNFANEFTTAEADFSRMVKGGISIIAQSGVLGNMFVDWSWANKIGLAKTITLGNKIDVDEIDMIEYLENDPETNVITLYLEGVKRGNEFKNILKKAKKPVLILKNGRSNIGTMAAMSHTGSIAGNDKIFDAVIKQHKGIFRVSNFHEMIDIANVFSTQPLPKGKNIAIITGSGSLGILACDDIDKNGLNLAQFTKDTIKTMRDITPDFVSVKNPVDVGPALATTIMPSIKAVFNDENVDAVLYIFAIPRWVLETFNVSVSPHFRLMNKLSKKLNKPCVCVAFGSRWVFEYANKSASKFNIPIAIRIKHAIKALKMMYEYNQNKK